MEKTRHLCKLNQSGVAHYALGALVFILIIGGIGTYVIFNSQAATPTTAATGTITGIGIKCLDDYHSIKANYAKVDLWGCNGGNAQKWTVNTNGTITNSNGECLDVYHSGTIDYTKVDLFPCNNGVAQQWTVSTTSKTIVNPHSGKCLDDYHSITTNGNQIDIFKCNGTLAQQWTAPMAATTGGGGGTGTGSGGGGGSTGGSGGGSGGGTTSSSEDIVTTLYAYPTLPIWQQVESGYPAVQYAIIDICAPDGSGSGCSATKPVADAQNTDWLPTISALNAAKITPLFYISTNYAATPIATVEGEMNNAVNWYKTPDMMFDETSTNNASYYQQLFNYAVNTLHANKVMFNPGTQVDQSYMFGADVIMQMFEGSAAQFESTTFPSWMQTYKADQFSVTISAGTATTVGNDVNEAVKANIGNFYEDDEPETPNYSTLPAFWTAELTDIKNAN